MVLFQDNRWRWALGAVGLRNYSDFVCNILARTEAGRLQKGVHQLSPGKTVYDFGVHQLSISDGNGFNSISPHLLRPDCPSRVRRRKRAEGCLPLCASLRVSAHRRRAPTIRACFATIIDGRPTHSFNYRDQNQPVLPQSPRSFTISSMPKSRSNFSAAL